VEGLNPQHLYVTVDDKIKVGDWFICNQAAQQCVEIRENNDYPYKIINKFNGKEQWQSKHWRGVIIATDDKSLYTNDEITAKDISYGRTSYIKEKDAHYLNLHGISTGFIQRYYRKYNTGNIITDIKVFYETAYKPSIYYYNIMISYSNDIHPIPQISPLKSSEVLEKTYTRHQVIKILDKFAMMYLEDSHGCDEEFINNYL
jgi:hypothetical protein